MEIIDSAEIYIDDVVNIEHSNPHPLWSKKNFLDSLRCDDFFKIALCDGKVAAFIVSKIMGKECEIINLGTLPKMRRKLLASKLIQELINFSKNKFLDQIFLEVRESNDAAINLYNKFGFNELGIRANYYQRDKGREDAIIMGLTL